LQITLAVSIHPFYNLLTGNGHVSAVTEIAVNTSDDSSSELELSEVLANLNTRLARLHSALPKNTAFIVMNGHSDPRPMLELSARRARWERAMKEKANTGDWSEELVEDKWYAEDDRLLERRVAEAREGMAFFCVK
jgi:RNA exonuclease 1